MSTVKKKDKKENVLPAGMSASDASSPRSIKAFFARLRNKGQQRVTIMLVPHSERKVFNIQLSFFALGGVLAAVALVVLGFLFVLARFSETSSALQSRSSDLATTQASLDAIRKETKDLIVAARRFDSALAAGDSSAAAASDDSSQAASPSAATSAAAPAASSPGSPLAQVDTDSKTAGPSKAEVDREIAQLQSATTYIQNSLDALKSLGSQLQYQSSVFTEIPNIWPIRGAGHIELYYGQAENPVNGQWYLNKGIDISTYRTGDPVLATANGTVSSLGYDPIQGNYIVIQHSHGFFTRYGNLMAFRVTRGQKVSQGQIIALLGNTGLTAQPLLHYEVHIGTGVIDPVKFLNLRAAAVAAE